MPTKKRGRPKKSVEEYILTLTVGDTVTTGTGKTILEALESMPTPPKIVGKSTLLVQKGLLKRSLLLAIPQAKRLFYPLAQPVVAKQLGVGLK